MRYSKTYRAITMIKSKRWTLLFVLSLLTLLWDGQSTANAAGLELLVGGWVRSDGGYALKINEVRKNGEVDAAYFNPNPINISQAQASLRSGQINLFIELRDKGYPGSFYTLTYNQGTDSLVGVYHHLGMNKKFDVNFVRVESLNKKFI